VNLEQLFGSTSPDLEKGKAAIQTIVDMMAGMAILRVHVVPNAKSDSVVGEHGGAIKIKLRASAVEGKANAALISFLAEQLNISRRAIALERGHKSRDKLIRINGLSQENVRNRLRERD
jgi:uncharacterized protein (TIGR00251 family)